MVVREKPKKIFDGSPVEGWHRMLDITYVATGSKVDHSTAELVTGSMYAKLFKCEGRETSGALTN